MSIRLVHVKPLKDSVNGEKTHIKYESGLWRIFLGGTIEMGNSRNWQGEFFTKLSSKLFSSKQKESTQIAVLNPRRDNWDSTWKQTIKNKNFKDQVNWEMDMLHCSDIIVFNILPNSKSPITLLEIGYIAGLPHTKKVFICCPDEFYRKGNIEVVCDRYGFNLFDDEDEMFDEVFKVVTKEKKPEEFFTK